MAKVTNESLAHLLGWKCKWRTHWHPPTGSTVVAVSYSCPEFTKSVDILTAEMKRLGIPWSYDSAGEASVGRYGGAYLGQEPAEALADLLYTELLYNPPPKKNLLKEAVRKARGGEAPPLRRGLA